MSFDDPLKSLITFHLVLHPTLSSTTDPGRPGRPFLCLIGLLAEAGSSYPPYPPGRLQVVAPNGLTQLGRASCRKSYM